MKTKKQKITWKDSLYVFRMVLMIVFLVFTLMLLPNILSAGWQGILFLISMGIFVITTLWFILKNGKKGKEHFGYNFLYIGCVGYLGLIWGRLFFDERVKMTLLYRLDMNYFKNNYLILSIILLGIIFNTLLIQFEEK